MNALKYFFFACALAMVLGSCAEKPQPETIIDQSDCSDDSRFKDGCD
ncbi:MAG TPA: hypothetical protein VLM37_03290 [Fibrobacteraceae bacterium]|nr:hypothetical protein [Fibrobacteraceae bacterium]